MIFILKENENSHESTRNQNENAKLHSGYCNRTCTFGIVCAKLILRRRNDRQFLTIEQLY